MRGCGKRKRKPYLLGKHGEISVSVKDKHCMIMLNEVSKIGTLTEAENEMVVARRLRVWCGGVVV